MGKIKDGFRHRLSAYRNPVYLVYALAGVGLFILGALIANSGVGPLESSIFHAFNNLSDRWYWLFWVISLFGTIGMAMVFAAIFFVRRNFANGIKILMASIMAYALAYGLKLLDFRARPEAFFPNAAIREDAATTLGYPSGHVAVATVIALCSYQYLPKRWHKYLTSMVIAVAISRMYLGVHLPVDLIGGFALGLVVGGLMNFAFGTRKMSAVDPAIVKNKMIALGTPAKTVTLASVDARGSIPYYGTLKDGTKVFIKIVGRENNIADWLFKSWRKIIYRRLEDEAPFLTAKRQLEHEAYVSSLALLAGVRTPKVIGIFETEKDRWAHAQYAIAGKSLDRVDKSKITDSVLKEIWKQVQIMHNASIVHRDLRCANIFLDDKNTPWVIDFGFSEASMPEDAKNRDRAELIASLSTLVGAERSIKAAHKALGRDKLIQASSYLTTGMLSSATSRLLKKSEVDLPALRKMIAKDTKLPLPKPIAIKRFSLRRMIIVIALAVALFVIVPKLGEFQSSWETLRQARWWLAVMALGFSLITYMFAAASYRFLVIYPISYIKIFVVEIASSFASKLAPAGAGSLALNGKFLVKNNHTIPEATSIAAINNIMGLIGHLSILLVIVLFGASSFRDAFSFKIHIPPLLVVAVVSVILVVSGAIYAIPKLKNKIIKVVKQTADDIFKFRNQPLKLFGSYVASICTTLAYCGALYASAHALGSTLNPLQIIVVFTVGVAASSITPTPGGIGGAEAGLVAGLTATGMDASQALAITLLYRLVTYWLPIIPGFIGFQFAIKKEYV